MFRFLFSAGVSAVLSAPPSLHPRDPLDNIELLSAANTAANAVAATMSNSGQPLNTIIEAKPQLKNLIGDATRFVPTSLKVRRVVKDFNGKVITVGGGTSTSSSVGMGSRFYIRLSLNKFVLHPLSLGHPTLFQLFADVCMHLISHNLWLGLLGHVYTFHPIS